MKIQLSLLIIIFLNSCSKNDNTSSDIINVNDIKICTWLNNATSAVSFTFDDSNIIHGKIANLLEKYNYYGSFYVNPGKGDWNKLGPVYKSMAIKGHEIGNHSWNHAYFNEIPQDSIIKEVSTPIPFIQNVIGIYPISFVQPGNRTNKAVDSIVLSYHPFCRNSSFYSMNNRLKYSILSNTNILDVHRKIEESINERKWLIIAGHGMDGVGWEPVTSEFLSNICRVIKSKESEIWVGTLAEVAAYEYVKNELKIKSKINKSLLSIKFEFDKSKYRNISRLPISLEIPLDKNYKLEIQNTGQPVVLLKNLNSYIITLDIKCIDTLNLNVCYFS